MRFISQFEVSWDLLCKPDHQSIVDAHKARYELCIGEMIGESFGWQNRDWEPPNRFTLEVTAFPFEKWEKFKAELKDYIEAANKNGLGTFNLIMIGKMIQELDSYGKPAGATKELPQP